MGGANVGFGSEKSKYTYSGKTSESKYGIFQYFIGVGASYFLTEKIAIDMLIDYKSSNYKLKSESGASKSTASEDISDKYSGIDVSFGIVVIIPN